MGQRHIAIDGDGAAGADFDAAETLAAEPVGIQPHGISAVSGQRGLRIQADRHVGNVPDPDVAGVQVNAPERGILPYPQRTGERRCILHLLVAIGDTGCARAVLPFARDHAGDDLGLEDRRRRRQV